MMLESGNHAALSCNLCHVEFDYNVEYRTNNNCLMWTAVCSTMSIRWAWIMTECISESLPSVEHVVLCRRARLVCYHVPPSNRQRRVKVSLTTAPTSLLSCSSCITSTCSLKSLLGLVWFQLYPTFDMISNYIQHLIWFQLYPTFDMISTISNIWYDFNYIQHFIWFQLYPAFYMISTISNTWYDFNYIQHFYMCFISGKSPSFDFKTSRSNFFRCFNSYKIFNVAEGYQRGYPIELAT